MVQFFGFLAWCLVKEVNSAAALGLSQDDDDHEDWTKDAPLAAEPAGVTWSGTTQMIPSNRHAGFRTEPASRCP